MHWHQCENWSQNIRSVFELGSTVRIFRLYHFRYIHIEKKNILLTNEVDSVSKFMFLHGKIWSFAFKCVLVCLGLFGWYLFSILNRRIIPSFRSKSFNENKLLLYLYLLLYREVFINQLIKHCQEDWLILSVNLLLCLSISR